MYEIIYKKESRWIQVYSPMTHLTTINVAKAHSMGSLTVTATTHLISSIPSQALFNPTNSPLQIPLHLHCKYFIPLNITTNHKSLRLSVAKTRATLDENDQNTPTSILVQDEVQPNEEVEESVKLLKDAAKTRRVASEKVLSALSVLEKTKLDPSRFLQMLGGSKSPGKTWMLIFTAEKQLKSGKYFPITAVQRFDAAAKRIENGVYLGSIGCLTFEGRFTWKNRILAFIFERIRIKIGPFNPWDISFPGKDEREPSTKDPFFIWFYVDEEIAVARGRSGGTAFWCRCRRFSSF